MTGDQKDEAAGHATEGEALSPAEAKRLAARRRFLIGGAVALPLIVSVSRESYAGDDDDARMVGRSLCMSIGIAKKDSKKNTMMSVMCKVRT